MTDRGLRMKNLKPLGIYIHIPFCIRKCKYCDFLSFAADENTKKQYVEKLCTEIEHFFAQYKEYEVRTVFFGGGTPSILEVTLIGKIMETLKKAVPFMEEAEISLEANPGTLSEEKLKEYRECGINRLSIGLQSTEEKELKYLGRIHSYEDFLKSYELARQAGFTNINVDLMSAVPYQTLESWEKTLDRVLLLKPEHISAYSLIVEEGTPFYEDDRLEELLADEDIEREMYVRTEEKLLEYGYHRYEVSNYAKEGRECAHNVLYWKRGDYIGFGLGAASCIHNMRFKNTDSMKEYMEMPWRKPEERWEVEHLSLREQMEETMILGLRMTGGVSKREFESLYDKTMESEFGDAIEKHKADGLLTEEDGWLRFTRKGLDLSNMVLCDFLATV